MLITYCFKQKGSDLKKVIWQCLLTPTSGVGVNIHGQVIFLDIWQPFKYMATFRDVGKIFFGGLERRVEICYVALLEHCPHTGQMFLRCKQFYISETGVSMNI